MVCLSDDWKSEQWMGVIHEHEWIKVASLAENVTLKYDVQPTNQELVPSEGNGLENIWTVGTVFENPTSSLGFLRYTTVPVSKSIGSLAFTHTVKPVKFLYNVLQDFELCSKSRFIDYEASLLTFMSVFLWRDYLYSYYTDNCFTCFLASSESVTLLKGIPKQ